MTYLGVTIGMSQKKKLFWEPLLKRIDNRLASKKCTNLNVAGRIVLLKATIDSLPSYWFNTFMPLSVRRRVDLM